MSIQSQYRLCVHANMERAGGAQRERDAGPGALERCAPRDEHRVEHSLHVQHACVAQVHAPQHRLLRLQHRLHARHAAQSVHSSILHADLTLTQLLYSYILLLYIVQYSSLLFEYTVASHLKPPRKTLWLKTAARPNAQAAQRSARCR